MPLLSLVNSGIKTDTITDSTSNTLSVKTQLDTHTSVHTCKHIRTLKRLLHYMQTEENH